MGNQNSGRPKLYIEWHKINAINKLWEKVERKVLVGDELTEFEEKLVHSLLPRTIQTKTDITSAGKSLVVNIDKDIADKNNVINSKSKDYSERQTQV